MALGDSTWNVVAGGGQQKTNSASLARSLVQLGVCTGPGPTSIVNTLLQPGDLNGLIAACGRGPLVEAAALRLRLGLPCYVMPVNASTAGGVSASVSQTGSGSGAIAVTVAPDVSIGVLCSTSGALGTAAFQFSVNGGAYGAPVVSVAGSTWIYNVPGTFCALTFGTASYVATKTLTVGVNGTVTPGSGWVGTVTQVSSPIDYYDVYVYVKTGGAPGVAVLQVSLDGGPGPTGGGSFLPDIQIPSGGVVVIPGTGLVLTCSSNFNATDYYTFSACPPSHSTSDANTAITALQQLKNVSFEQVHVITLPASASGAASMLSTVDTAMTTSFNTYGLDWGGMTECPSASANVSGAGDIVMSGSNAIRDTADTDTVVSAARGTDTNRTAMHVGTYRIPSPVTGRKQLRPLGWAVAARFVDTDPSQDLAALMPFGSLNIYQPAGATTIGRDEALASVPLDAAQFNTCRQYRGRTGGYLSITSGGSGWKNASQTAVWQDKGFVRILNVAIASLRQVAQNFLGQRPPVNADGTIEESTRRAWSTMLDIAIKKATGIIPGAGFSGPQVSVATAQVSASSQLGQAPKLLVINYVLVSLGFVSAVQNNMYFSNTLSAAS